MELAPANVVDIHKINRLVEESEEYSYGESFDVNMFRKHYKISESKLQSTKNYSAIENGETIGFVMIIYNDDQYELEYYYLCKSKIGMGYGKRLWDLLIAKCREENILKFNIFCSKNITPFYLKMGAKPVSELRSKLDLKRIIDEVIFFVN